MRAPFYSGSTQLFLELDISDINFSFNDADRTAVTISVVPPADAASYRFQVVAPLGNFGAPMINHVSTSNSYTVTGLVPGTTYQARVLAYNSLDGTGNPGIHPQESFQMPVDANNSKVVSTTTVNHNILPSTGGQFGLKLPDEDRVYTEVTTTTTNVDGSKVVTTTTIAGFDTTVYAGKTATEAASSPNTISTVTSQVAADGTVTTSNTSSNGSTTTKTVSPVPTGSTTINTSKSLFALTNNSSSSDDYSLAYKTFSEIPTGSEYYSFGTTIFMENNTNNTNASGGIGFFVSEGGADGYYVRVDTTVRSSSADRKKEVSIMKIKSNKIIALTDSQTTQATTLAGVYSGRAYRIDIKVKCTATYNFITVYVNGFRITAYDYNDQDSDIPNVILPNNNNNVKRVAMMANRGQVYFDYVYGMSLTAEQYDKDYIYNVYSGQYSENAISFLFGDKVISSTDLSDPINGRVEDFGSIAREIKSFDIKFNTRPGFPLPPSTGINKFAKVIGSRLSPFGAEAYVLNNAGTYVALDDSNTSSFYIGGKTISRSGVLEYSDDIENLSTVDEPIVFESMWIQKLSDAVNLGKWIKDKWSKKQTMVDLEVFGNPYLSVGDVISIDYPYNGLTTSQKFLVLNVNHSYSEGLTTSLLCRSI